MNPASIRKVLTSLNIKKNVLFLISVALLVSNVILSIFVISSKEKIIIVPPSLKEEFSVSGSDFSDSYIEQMTLFFSDLLLDLTPDNIKYKSEILLKYVDSSSYHALSEYYEKEAEKHKK
ncbi:Type IV conjugative transfer system protein TraE N-terminal domain protein [Candidatus Cyrtobacter comes]|uniref:Type IV conjugative transfer system protein TraE N-terminal domain protein n=1 Tax=Candidatus Cyrtobacter comes TaxID=675776 RepID=A0ABU5L9N6_9RICK|nr:TraE/TraK family type IV conjugative transfer system protein [Candidatus Cyrtobacter comes]MDZ5762757.1 Type IV conjugative transfer system protein TraE N-terminal domain protein [Candidatus Cyrtobacter comes]